MKQNITEINNKLDRGVSCLMNHEYDKAVKIFHSILQIDDSFTSFEHLNNIIKCSAPGELPFDLKLTTRQAMMCLGIIYALKEKNKIAEEYVLDATYLCQDAYINLLGGNFYLAIRDAQLSAAFGFFKRAIMIKPEIFGICDELVHNFFNGKRALYYPISSLQPYIELWDSIKKETVYEKKQDRISDFVKSALSTLGELDALALQLIRKMLKRDL